MVWWYPTIKKQHVWLGGTEKKNLWGGVWALSKIKKNGIVIAGRAGALLVIKEYSEGATA